MQTVPRRNASVDASDPMRPSGSRRLDGQFPQPARTTPGGLSSGRRVRIEGLERQLLVDEPLEVVQVHDRTQGT